MDESKTCCVTMIILPSKNLIDKISPIILFIVQVSRMHVKAKKKKCIANDISKTESNPKFTDLHLRLDTEYEKLLV